MFFEFIVNVCVFQMFEILFEARRSAKLGKKNGVVTARNGPFKVWLTKGKKTYMIPSTFGDSMNI